jgi:hypothetical protein
MTLWKIERGANQKFVIDDPTCFLDLVALLAIATAPGLFLVILIPLPLVLPVLSVVSFVAACGIAVFAHFSETRHRRGSLVHWELACAFAFVWVASGMMGNPRTLLDWFDRVAMTP